jgi:putative serine protease PepD
MRRGALAGVALAAVAGLATYGFFALRPAGGGLSGNGLNGNGLRAAVLRHAEASTVRLLMGSPSDYEGSGSGTLLSPTGMILTNAHVAQPQAPGLAVALGQAQPGTNPPFLTVEMTTGPSSPVVAKYRAKTVAVDGYLDLAVIQIYATASGKPVNPGSLHLPYYTLGNVAKLQLDQPLTVLGFPAVADSDSITITSGVLSTFVPDDLKHVKDPRFQIETTARVAHGNSGGAGIDSAGHLIGVPSLERTGQDADVSFRLRSIAEAAPLIAAARHHVAYQSKILVQMTGTESVTGSGVGATVSAACSGHPAVASGDLAVFGINTAGFPPGLDYEAHVIMPDGTVLPMEEGTTVKDTTCLYFGMAASDVNAAKMPVGAYHLQLLAGPSLTQVGPVTVVHITASATAPAGN